MAKFGWLSLRCGLASIRSDMDYCPRLSSSRSGAAATSRNHPPSGQSGTGPRASSCLSSTMVEHIDPDDSGSSQPHTSTGTTAESSHFVIRDSPRPFPRHDLELSISNLNDAQRSSSGAAGPPLSSPLTSVKDEFDPISTRKAITSRPQGEGEDATSFFGPPRKQARLSPSGFRLDEGPTERVRDQLQRHPSLTVSLSVSSDVTSPPPSLVPNRSMPSFRLAENDPSPSRGRTSGPESSNATMSWWLGPGARTSNPTEGLQYHPGQSSTRASFGVDGRGLIPGTTLQERDVLSKQTTFFPNVLRSMEALSDHHLRRDSGLGAEGRRPVASSSSSIGAKAPGGAGGDGHDPNIHGGHDQSQYVLDFPHGHTFFQRKETSTSRTSDISNVSDETVPRSGNPVFSGGKIEEPFLKSLPPQDSNIYGHQITQSPIDAGRRRNSVAIESPLGVHKRDIDLPLPHGLSRSHQPAERAAQGGPGGNANTTFYARIWDAAQQPTPSSSLPSQTAAAGLPAAFEVSLGAQPAARASAARVGSAGPIHFIGEPVGSINVVPQVGGSDVLPNVGGNPGSFSPFSSQAQNLEHVRLSLPSRNSLEFLQTLQPQQQQKQPFPSQGVERYGLSPSSGQVGRGPGASPGHQEYSFLGSQPSHPTSSAGVHPPSRATGNLQSWSGFQEFSSPPAFKGVDLPHGGGPRQGQGAGSQTVSSPGAEIPTRLSLQAPATPGLFVLRDGQSTGRRIRLQDYDGYDSFAAAMRNMCMSQTSTQESRAHELEESSTLANAIPGYVIAYEDEEGDILLAGDLPWREFVRVAKQIRIVSSLRISFKPPARPSRS